MSGYGQNYDNNSVEVFNAGINNDVTLTKFELVTLDGPKYQGSACDVEWTKSGQSIKARLFPVDESRITTRSIREKDASGNQVERMQTEQEAKEQAYGQFNSMVKHIAGCAITDEEWKEATKGAKDFDSFITLAAALVTGKNYTGQLILGYDNAGYKKIPRAMYVTKAFWSVNGRHQLVFTEKNGFKATKAAPVSQEQAASTDW